MTAEQTQSSPETTSAPPRFRRVVTPTVLQMEAVECGAAALAIVLAYYGRFVPLEELRIACGVSRDGSKASNVVKAARCYGLTAGGKRKEPKDLHELPLPMIVFWEFNHFLVVEGFGKGKVYLNDPGYGPRVVTDEEFDRSFTGVVLVLEPGPDFVKQGRPASLTAALRARLSGSRLALTYVLLAGLALVIPGLAIPAFTKVFVDSVLVAGSKEWIYPLLAGLLLTGILRGALTWLQAYYLLRLETKLALSMSGQFLWHVLRLPVQFFTQRQLGDIATRVAANDRVATLLSGELATNALGALMVIFYALMMLQYDALLTAIGIAVALLNVAALRYFSRKRVDGNRRLLQETGKLFGTASGGLQIIESIKASGGDADFFSRFAGHHAKVVNGEQELGRLTELLNTTPQLLTGLTTMAILGIGALRVIDGYLTVGGLVAFISLLTAFTAPIGVLLQLGGRLQEAEGDMNRLQDVLRYEQDAQIARQETQEGGFAQSMTGALELRDVSFGYSRLEAPLVEGFSLSLRPGDRVALVGGSGSGKSTIAKLIAGLYEPWGGEILFDGRPRHLWPRPVWTSSVAMVDQDIFLFEGSVRENITLWDNTVPEAAITRAALDACIHEDVAARPAGYDSPVAEAGANFSGGQRQRLEIARAIVGEPTVVVLDEATSALDPITEKRVDENLRRRGCTCLIVAHRLSTIRDCDEIIVLDKGKVVERGSYEALRQNRGPFYRLTQVGEGESVGE